MPVYTYRCQSCGVAFKKTQAFIEKPLKRCPECQRGTVRRVPQLPAIVFKGSGWYSTDQRSASSPITPPSQKQDKAEGSHREKSTI